ncbi:ArsR/SmtB family transcription factor [Roseobacter sinensis]|uniref:Metalloregulator ArsR/SmtB family transcription factor n=1 Tax=Roseobacter sinensis TaxID=2931391 RepID=A0ABT3BLR7_9RHOB|nr:metalloregulator ArsR/SmtB family transcription factor [Roseobacter sp. WL0113]MCV3274109.1 metalloregulator ArsR/SmtB family transcription factor [Roseobacter sp. WL0113]
MKESAALDAFAAMSNETRLRILKRLVAAGPTGLPAGEIADAVGASPSRTSFHLSTMAAAGIIRAQRQARQIVYAADFMALGALVRFLLEECCSNDPTVRACCGLAADPASETQTPARSGGCDDA